MLAQSPLHESKACSAGQLERHFSKWSVCTRSSERWTDDEVESGGRTPCSPSTDDGTDNSDALSEVSSSSAAWETASEGESDEEARLVYTVESLLRERSRPGKDSNPGVHCRQLPLQDLPEADRYTSSPSALRSAKGDDDEAARRAVRAILNKLTVDKFHALYEQLLIAGTRTPAHVQLLLEEVFGKALVEHSFRPLYADLTARLASDARVTAVWATGEEPASSGAFKNLLLDMCQSCFDELLLPDDESLAAFSDVLEEEEAKSRLKHRRLGAATWIGELLVRGLLRSQLLCSCVHSLLEEQRDRPEFGEFAAALLRSAGATFDVESWGHRPQLLALFARLQELSEDPALSLRLRFLLRDLLELRAAGWRLPSSVQAEVVRPSAPRLAPALKARVEPSRAKGDGQFDLRAFRWMLSAILRDLRADRDAKKALARLRSAAVPRSMQADEFSDLITRIAEDGSGPARRAAFAFLVGLSVGEDSAFHRSECVRGAEIFFREVYAELRHEVPRLSVIMTAELLPLLRSAWSPVDVAVFIPKELQ